MHRVRKIRDWLLPRLTGPSSPTERLAWIAFVIFLLCAIFGVIAAIQSKDLYALLASVLLGLAASMLGASLSFLFTPDQPQPAGIRVFPTRASARETLKRIVAEAEVNVEGALQIAGVAATDFLLADNEIKDTLEKRLEERPEGRLRVRFILLNPDSESATVRDKLETYIRTKDTIALCIIQLERLVEDHPGQVEYTLHDHYQGFLCMNHKELLMHPYLVSATGNQTPVVVVHQSRGSGAYEFGKQHFKKIWDYEEGRDNIKGRPANPARAVTGPVAPGGNH